MEENQSNQDIEFIKEKVKERPLNRKKLMRRTLITASMAVIFGLIACITFLVLEPVFSNLLYPEEEPRQVELKEENINEEMKPEDMILEEETESEEPVVQTQTVVEKVELEMSDYQRLYRTMYSLVQQVSQSLVTVSGVVTDMDWFDNIYENEGQTVGLVIAENGRQLLILTDYNTVNQAETVEVSFSDDSRADASVIGQDVETGLVVIGVDLEDIPEETLASVKPATLGGSGASTLATPVIAVGRPMGTAPSVIYGMITSAETSANLTDNNVRILTTDMAGASNASGVLINLSGNVIGIIRSSKQSTDSSNLLTAWGITDLRKTIEKLSNGQEIACLGLVGTDVPAEVHEELGVPLGAYVKEIRMDSPAMQAGIQSGDVIVKLGETEITSFAAYHDALMELAPEMTVTLTVMRQGQDEYQEMTIDVMLGR